MQEVSNYPHDPEKRELMEKARKYIAIASEQIAETIADLGLELKDARADVRRLEEAGIQREAREMEHIARYVKAEAEVDRLKAELAEALGSRCDYGCSQCESWGEVTLAEVDAAQAERSL